MRILPITLASAALLLAACLPIQPPSGTVPPPDGTVPAPPPATLPAGAEEAFSGSERTATALQFTSGEICLWAGGGATLAFDGERVTYTCGTEAGSDDGHVLLGMPTEGTDETLLDLVRATLVRGSDGFTLADRTEVTARVQGVQLMDGTLCLNAGQGATMGFDETGRLNFTCGDPMGDSFEGLMGPLVAGEFGQWAVLRARISRTADGFALDSAAWVPVSALELEEQ